MADEIEVEPIETRYVDEFDRGTRITLMNDGSIELKFPSIPASWKCTDGAFDSFHDELSKRLGVRVLGVDKELFSIRSAEPTHLHDVENVLLAFRRDHERK